MAALAGYVLRRTPQAARDRRHRLVRQDQHEGPRRRRCSSPPDRRWRRPARTTMSSGCRSRCCARDAATRFLVLEMGARGRGHIARLCAIAPPSIGVVLNVGTAHLGEFGSRQAIAEARASWSEAACDARGPERRRPAGAWRWRRAPALASSPSARILTLEVRAEDVDIDGQGRAGFTLVSPRGRARTPAATGRCPPCQQRARGGGGRAGVRCVRRHRWRRGLPRPGPRSPMADGGR